MATSRTISKRGPLARVVAVSAVIAIATLATSKGTAEAPAVPVPVQSTSTTAVRTWTIQYTSHTGLARVAYVVLPAWYGPNAHPPLPVVISPHGRGANGRSNAQFFGRMPGIGGFALISPDGMGRRLKRFSYGHPGQIDDLAKMPDLAVRASAVAPPRQIADLRSRKQHRAGRRRCCSSRGTLACSRAPPQWTRSPISLAGTHSCLNFRATSVASSGRASPRASCCSRR